jgi:dipeptidyl aminopeptidase/acylaminoacyl peptidase
VPVEQSEAMHAALRRAGVRAQLYIEPNAGHGFDAAWQDAPDELGRVFQFLQSVL